MNLVIVMMMSKRKNIDAFERQIEEHRLPYGPCPGDL